MKKKVKNNQERLVRQSGMGIIRQPFLRTMPWMVSDTGKPFILPRMGSITYNVKIGDSVYGMEGDHIEPGVTIKNPEEEENNALNLLSCVGNTATVLTGQAKGSKGFVTGHHGGVNHVLVYFPQEVLEKMTIEDKIEIRMQGRGMKIEGFEDTIHCISMGSELFERMDLYMENEKLIVPVAAKVPAYLMGSGIGEFSSVAGDYDIMTADWDEIKRLGLDKLRYGDLVMLEDCDNTYGRGYKRGAVSIGIIIHGNSILMGHGPGVSTLLTAKNTVMEGRVSKQANLAEIMGIHK